jgi:hypothetical protein
MVAFIIPLSSLLVAAALSSASVALAGMRADAREKTEFPLSYELFSSKFQQPKPPTVQSEFKANWKQHAWYGILPVHSTSQLFL